MDFYEILQTVILQAKAAEIPISERIDPHVAVNTRAKKRYGRCIYKNGFYAIELSAYLKEADSALVHTVVAHELLHTCPGCLNHGERWKHHAAVMQKQYGYIIERTAKEPLAQERPAEARYLLECTACGMQIARQKKSKAVEYPYLYRCKCGGKLRRLR